MSLLTSTVALEVIEARSIVEARVRVWVMKRDW
jgi:hypothetical protein